MTPESAHGCLPPWRQADLPAPLPFSFRNAFRTTIIGFTATFLLPARVGEVLRPYLLARQEGFTAPATFATVVIERLLDVTAVLLLFAGGVPFLGVPVGGDVAPSARDGDKCLRGV